MGSRYLQIKIHHRFKKIKKSIILTCIDSSNDYIDNLTKQKLIKKYHGLGGIFYL